MNNRSKSRFRNSFAGSLILPMFVVAPSGAHSEKLPLLSHFLGAEARQFITFPLFTVGKLAITFTFILKTCVFLTLLFFFSSRIRAFLYTTLIRHTAVSPQHGYMLARFASLAVFTVGLMVGFESVGLNPSSLAILGGTLGIGVGFGLQSVVANWVAGVVLLIEQPVRIGDRVDMEGATGVVTKIGGRSTWIRTYSNEVLIVPNSNLTNNLLINWTANDPKVRLAIPVAVAYSSDPEQVRALLLKIAVEHPNVLAEPPPEVIFKDLGTSSLDFLLRFWTIVRDRDNCAVISDLYFAIFRVFRLFRAHNIEIPFTKTDGHTHSAQVPADRADQ